MNTTDRNEFAKNKTMGEVMDLIAKKWDLMGDDEKEEVAAFLSDTRPRTKENREVTYRQMIDTLTSKWNEFEDWKKLELTEIIDDLKHENTGSIIVNIIKRTNVKLNSISHHFHLDTINEKDLLRRAILIIYMFEKDLVDGAYEITTIIDEKLDAQYIVVIEEKRVTSVGEFNEIDLKIWGVPSADE